MTSARSRPLKRTSELRYRLYEESVQTPEQHCEMFALMYNDLMGQTAHVLREDFCGTYLISSYWVKRDPRNRAIGLDLDPEPLAHGKKHHWAKLKPSERKRVKAIRKNVISVTAPKADLVVACNFSFFIFKERATLVKYFKAVHKSLARKGVFVLELAGGPGMIEPTKEQQSAELHRVGKFTYVWHQKSFNPITHDGLYAIHFKLPDGTVWKDAFVYDWRVWSIPEVREALREAGFKDTYVYWDLNKPSLGSHEYGRTEKASNDYSWIAYIAAAKK